MTGNLHQPARGPRGPGAPILAALVLTAIAAAGCGSAGGGPGADISPPTGTASAPPTPGPTPAPRPVRLEDVQMTSTADGWALLSPGSGGSSDLELARTSDGGRTWTPSSPPGAGQLVSSQVLLEASSRQRAWLAVSNGSSTTRVFGTSDGGQSWQGPGQLPAAQPVAMDFTSPADGWLLDSLGAAMGSNPVRLFRSTDGGQHWSSEARSAMGSQPEVGGIPAGCDKSGMSFNGAGQSGFITSFCNSLAGAVLQSADGGEHWTAASLPIPHQACQSGGCEVPAPQFAGKTTFLQVNDGPDPAYLLVSPDSGGTWRVERLPAGAGADPRLTFFSPSAGIAVAAGSQESVGTSTYLTSDGGQSWSAVPLARPFGDAGASFDFVSPHAGFAWVPGSTAPASSQVLYQTTDSGRTWTSFAPSLN
jgi:photosystem II stability/assembly factor-like uncharacterized protein